MIWHNIPRYIYISHINAERIPQRKIKKYLEIILSKNLFVSLQSLFHKIILKYYFFSKFLNNNIRSPNKKITIFYLYKQKKINLKLFKMLKNYLYTNKKYR